MGGHPAGAGREEGGEDGRPLELGGSAVGGVGPREARPLWTGAMVRGTWRRGELGLGVGKGPGQGMVPVTLTRLLVKGGTLGHLGPWGTHGGGWRNRKGTLRESWRTPSAAS